MFHGRFSIHFLSRLLLASLSSKRFEECTRRLRCTDPTSVSFFFPPPLPSPSLDPPLSFLSTDVQPSKNKKKRKEKIFLLSRRDVTCCVSTRRRRLRRLYAWSGASDSEFKLFYPWIANKLTAWHLWYYYVITAATRRDVPSLCLSLSPSFFFSFSLCRLLIVFFYGA